MRKKFVFVSILLLAVFFLNGCNNGIQVSNIKFIYSNSFYFEPARGKEINFYGDCDDRFGTWMDNKPEEIDLLITVNNPNIFSVNQSVLNIELWFDKSKSYFSEDSDNYDEALDKMYKEAKPELVWEKSITVQNLKPFKHKLIRIENIKIRDLLKKEFNNDRINGLNNYIMGIKCIAKSVNSLERYIIYKIGY